MTPDDNHQGDVGKLSVPHDCYALRCAVSNLWKSRLDNKTADQVLSSEGDLLAALAALSALVNDVRASNDKNYVQAAE